MKNKKLFAILTLVCFMFTLMPVAAFADYDATDYVVQVKEGGQWGDDAYLSTEDGVVVRAFDGTAEFVNAAFYVVDENGDVVELEYAVANGVTFDLEAGVYTIYGVVDNTIATQEGASTELKDLIADTKKLVDGVSLEDAVKTIKKQLKDDLIAGFATATMEAPYARHIVNVSDDSVTVKADNGFSSLGSETVEVELLHGDDEVVGKVPTISAPDYVTVTPANPKKVVTDAAGKITYKITANKAGSFKVVFSYADAQAKTVAVSAYTEGITNVEVVKESANLINNAYNAEGIKTGAVVKFTDANGSVVSVATTSTALEFTATGLNTTDGEVNYQAVKAAVVSQPTGSKLNASAVKLVPSTTVPGAFEVVVDAPAAGLKVGSYNVRFALEDGKAVTVGFEAAKFTKAVGIRFVQPATTIALGDTLPTLAVEKFDANGVVSGMDIDTDYTLSYQGKALTVVEGVLKVAIDEKLIGSTITVLAKDVNDAFVATTTLEVVAGGAEVVYANTTAEVGVTTQLKANVVDTKGNKVVVPTGGDMNIVVLEKPANAYVSATPAMGATDKDIVVTFLASVAGEYKIQTIITDGSDKFVTGIETIKVGLNDNAFKDVVVVSINADTIIVNDTVKAIPAAAVIENSRTFVPLRAVAEAFGAEVEWTPEAITAELGGVKVVMTTGDKAYTVNGVAKVADVAPYLNAEAATTMVPVSFIAQAFGINYQCIFAADGTVADVLFTK